MDINKKLEEIIENNSYDGAYGTEYYGDRIAKEAYNLGIETAANHAQADFEMVSGVSPTNSTSNIEVYVIKSSILNLKIE